MPETSTEEAIVPYLNPDYWDGHTLGYGEAEGSFYNEKRASDWFYNRADSRFAKEVLRATVRTEKPVYIHTFSKGMIFDPADYRAGTVILYRYEALQGPSVIEDTTLEALQGQEQPLVVSNTYPCIGHRVFRQSLDSQWGHYSNMLYWGVVPEHGDDQRLTSLNALAITPHVPEVHIHKIPAFNTLGPFIIGETVHKRSSREDHDEVRRINIMHLIAYGSPEAHKKRAKGFSWRTVTNES